MTNKKGQFNIKRKKVDNKTTITFMEDIKKLDSFGVGMTVDMMTKLLCVSRSALYRWEHEELIFPIRVGPHKEYKKYRYKDILRGFTIKYLMSELGFRRFIGVRLLLEMTNQVITSKDEPLGSINNFRIDRYLMKVLNYDVETIALMRMSNSNKKVKKEEKVNDVSE